MGLILAFLAVFAVGNISGGVIMHWKSGAEVALAVSDKEKVESRNSILEAANGNCATDIEGVRQGVKVITDAVSEREKAASAAMRDAQALVAKHKAAAVAIKALPVVPQAEQCEAIEREQIEYVAARHAAE
ncbi:hypothetical protein SAMN05216428_102357 [Nitrosospira sp. Nsp11]|uniref:hypothetical protein n=1 Tax=Nitrosospira sp. Nsp11 TaxID=1855338 RepID=UPI000912DBB5|nr:hypothetical protein [Nitrosospira sp. Nsp11]SHL42324.1 hypothetical protein SAMN05216428_102357 [Nitrosospira sp. Nsp11]